MNPQGQQTGSRTHERKDADVINLVMIAGLLLLALVVCLLLCGGIIHFFNRQRAAEEGPGGRTLEQSAKFPAPPLLINPTKEWQRVQQAEQRRLNGYGWTDREAGIAHIPITRAMELIVVQGLPEVGAGQTRLQLRQARPQTDIQPNEPILSPDPEAAP